MPLKLALLESLFSCSSISFLVTHITWHSHFVSGTRADHVSWPITTKSRGIRQFLQGDVSCSCVYRRWTTVDDVLGHVFMLLPRFHKFQPCYNKNICHCAIVELLNEWGKVSTIVFYHLIAPLMTWTFYLSSGTPPLLLDYTDRKQLSKWGLKCEIRHPHGPKIHFILRIQWKCINNLKETRVKRLARSTQDSFYKNMGNIRKISQLYDSDFDMLTSRQ